MISGLMVITQNFIFNVKTFGSYLMLPALLIIIIDGENKNRGFWVEIIPIRVNGKSVDGRFAKISRLTCRTLCFRVKRKPD